MPKLCLFIILLGLITTVSLPAQTISQIELLQNLPLPENYDYVTTRQDSLLHFYRIENTANTFVVKHWTCNHEGVLTTPVGIYSYSNVESWGTYFPSYRNYRKQFGNMYITFNVQTQYHILTVTESGSVRHNILPSDGYDTYHLFTQNYLFYKVWHINPNFCSIHRYNLNSGTSDSLFTWNGYTYPIFNVLGERYLLISDVIIGDQINSILIDTLQTAHPGIVTNAGGIYRINLESSEILPDTYFAGIEDGTLRDYSFGVLVIDNFNLHFTCIGSIVYMAGGVWGHFFNDIIPYGNGRFSCTEGLQDLGNLVYRNYSYNGFSFMEDNEFPNLTNFSNAYSLQRINDRYVVAIAGQTLGPRQFICIDYQNQTVTDSVFTFIDAPNIDYADLHSDNENLFYVYKTNLGMHLYILKIVENTANTDPVQPPQILTASAFPNPFIDHATIKLTLKRSEPVILNIYNLKGQLIRILSSQGKAEFTHELNWNGTTDKGTRAAVGLYLYKAITSTGQSISGRLMLVK